MGTLITNNETLMDEVLHSILPTTQRAFFLVGYFYFSGFQKIYESLKDTHLQILVGMNVEKDITNKIKEYEIYNEKDTTRSNIKKNFQESFVTIFNETDYFDSSEQQKAFSLFIDKIRDGSLEIRKTLKPNHAKLYLFEMKKESNQNGLMPGSMITGSSNFTASGLRHQHELNVLFHGEQYHEGKKIFDELWQDSIPIADKDNIDDFFTKVVGKTWFEQLPKPFLLYLRVLEEYFTIHTSERVKLPSEITRNKYYNLQYQTDAIQKAIEIINKHHGVIISDVVGLGKSIIGSAIAHNLKMKTIIICPPHLQEQWEDYRDDFDFNAFIYSSGKIDKALERNKDDEEQLIIIDEAHKYRNELTLDYVLLNRLCLGNRVVLLTATPFNNRPQDIFAMVKLFQIMAKSTIRTVDNLSFRFLELVREYKQIIDSQRQQKITQIELETRIKALSERIRDIIAPLIIRRTRKDLDTIEAYKQDLIEQNISFPVVEPPILQEFELGDLGPLYLETLLEICPADETKTGFIGTRYKPVVYLKNIQKYREKIKMDFGDAELFKQSQTNLAKFMQRLLVRRFESSIAAFQITLQSMIKSSELIKDWYERLGKVPIYKKGALPDVDSLLENVDEDMFGDLNNINFEVELKDYFEKGLVLVEKNELKEAFIKDLNHDINLLKSIYNNWFVNQQLPDPKVHDLKAILIEKLKENKQRKIIIFSEFKDTVEYVYEHLKDDFRIMKYSSTEATKGNKELIKTNFDASYKRHANEFDILIATDAISEGYNLHRAGIVFNYDIPYNPTRVIQRVGRINRIDKKVFDTLYIYNYFPTWIGEEKTRVRGISTLKFAMMNALLGEDVNVLTPGMDLFSYYKDQYEKELAASEEKSWDAPYLDFLTKMRALHPDVIQAAKDLPFRTRIGRQQPETNTGVILFGKKGDNYTFCFSDDGQSSQLLNAKDAIELFEAMQQEDALPNSEKFDSIYQFLKKELFFTKTQVQFEKAKAETTSKIKAIMKELPKLREYFEDLLQVQRDLDALPEYYAKRIRAISETRLDEEIEALQVEVTSEHLMKIIRLAGEIDEGKEFLILSEEFL